jgi:cell wall-associated NlpC family hydrolase
MIAALLFTALWTGGCIQPPRRSATEATLPRSSESRSIGPTAAGVARSMVGAPYRYGGNTPSGFDCSGLVRYSFARAGRPGLPHSVRGLAELARPVPIDSIEAGDLLFFSLGWLKKKSHVGIYLGDRRFVHAPSSGKSVEIVSFDHVYWGPRVEVAGRLTR